MALHVLVFLLVVCLLLALARLRRLCWFPFRPSYTKGVAKRSRLPRLLKPRCPDDCPACRLASTPLSGGGPAPAPVRPWREVKSRRGVPKRINTGGFACPNPQCRYFGNTDAQNHALVGDGKHGQAEQIQTLRCQACRTTFTSRRNTPLYRLKPPSQQVAVVLSALAEGLDPSAASRIFGFRQATITTWLTRAGSHAPGPARVLLPPSLAPTSPTGRTAHEVEEFSAGAVVVVSHRPADQDDSCAPARSSHPKHGPSAHPHAAAEPGSWLHPALYQ